MKEITIFYLEDCPYCHHARKALAELSRENPEYGGVPAVWVEESREAELANQYDYYYVPSVYAGREKLYEVDPSEDYASIKRNIRAALDEVLRRR